ncbi:MAG TPA: hypothetical protein VFI77_09130 [Gemmatimonadales bacterium]|nr:hypothetical protein [Gemmatimonadales bacterium]
MTRARSVILIAPLLLACAASAQQPEAAAPATPAPPPAAAPVPTMSLSGQSIAVMPMTMVAADPALVSDSLYAPWRDRRTALSTADSVIGDAFAGRAPEVKWVLPPDLRKIARRAPGIVEDPDLMGQAVLRSPKLHDIPDPLRSSLRNLMGVVGGRTVMVPAVIGFGRQADGRIRADLTLVLADVRNGHVIWRSVPTGTGATPREALDSALTVALPVDVGGP